MTSIERFIVMFCILLEVMSILLIFLAISNKIK